MTILAGPARAARVASVVRAGRAARTACAGCTVLGALCLFPARGDAQRQERPRLDSGRIAAESIGGAYAGIGGFLVGRYAGEAVGSALGVESDITRRRVGYATGAVTATFATAGFVYAIGSMGDTAGDFDATLLGSSAGLLAGFVVGKFVFPTGDDHTMSSKARWATINVLALLPSIGATIGFNSTRRFQ
jgi:hypothetical protein